jgi:hypothetical protein
MVAAANNSLEPSPASAHALTHGYLNLRTQILDAVRGSSLEAEFILSFPEFTPADPPDMRAAGNLGRQQHADIDAFGRRAKMLLGQLAGWLQGLIDEQTLEQRLKFEAEARIAHEQRRTGFSASTDT